MRNRLINRGYECTLPQAKRVAICALAGDLDSEELASGSQVRDPVLSRELGFDIVDRLDF